MPFLAVIGVLIGVVSGAISLYEKIEDIREKRKKKKNDKSDSE